MSPNQSVCRHTRYRPAGDLATRSDSCRLQELQALPDEANPYWVVRPAPGQVAPRTLITASAPGLPLWWRNAVLEGLSVGRARGHLGQAKKLRLPLCRIKDIIRR